MSKIKEQFLDVELERLMVKGDADTKAEYADIIRTRQLSRTLPFDQRNEVSADAVYIAGKIVSTMWIIGVGIPVLCGLLLIAITAMK